MTVLNQIKKFIRNRCKDCLLDIIFPGIYNIHRKKPVDKKKVVFIEPRLPELSNSFQVLYHELADHYDFDIHVHLLRETFVSTGEYIKNCKKMLEDLSDARYCFLNEASSVVSCINKRPETIVTQLWHACGAFKKFGMSTVGLAFGADEEQMKRHPFYKNLDYVTVSSPEVVWAYAEAMDLQDRKEIIRPVGISRTDVYFREETVQNAFQHVYEKFPAARGKKIILYAPTFRGKAGNAQAPDQFDLKKFYEAFHEDYTLIIKHHPVVRNQPEIPKDLSGTFAFDASDTLSIEDLLCVSDICISDYSSLIFEYSLFERPMLFYAYDLDEYFDWRGFYYPYDELTPGPVCTTNEEMIDYIQHVDERFDKQKVVDFRNKFMSACDGHATERIMDLVFGKEVLENNRK
ncbi:MAG: CDP-glycerol glycerophosphotransferase family protein [Clostridia bacterium]|nr:CDP-glycerol glycerophosphotransferase family protein [Clostridia bacterium]MDY5556088.1 CDP-glycerol glycerophosphotransferase family protein [Blautia sp.]